MFNNSYSTVNVVYNINEWNIGKHLEGPKIKWAYWILCYDSRFSELETSRIWTKDAESHAKIFAAESGV
jgi:hypothetical protein